MTNDTWGTWIEHTPGPCPIPGAKAGEYEVRFIGGGEYAPKTLDANHEHTYEWLDGTFTHYRLRNPAPDWEALAREAVMKITAHLKPLDSNQSTMDQIVAYDELSGFLDRARKAGVE